MSNSGNHYSIVKYFGENTKSHCGYCKTENSTSHGMWAYQMTVQDYQDLIDRGWRRSGQYCYKPCMNETCCPSYTIKSDANNFKLNNSHKKILKRFNKFLLDGKMKVTKYHEEQQSCSSNKKEDCSYNPSNDKFLLDEPKLKDNKEFELSNKVKTQINDLKCENVQPTSENVTNTTENVDEIPSKQPIRKKAKLLRIERKREKLAKKGLNVVEKPSTNIEKKLEDYFNDEPVNGVHQLKVITVPSKEGQTIQSFEVYKKYQTIIHNDSSEKLTMQRYTRFLIKSPIKMKLISVESIEFKRSLDASFKLYEKYQTIIHNDPPDDVSDYLRFLQKSPLQIIKTENGPPSGYGSFHQQYWLDEKLIAVAVLDILPKCISSVYFFYDPDYCFLTLGTYGSLREVYFTQQLSKTNPELCYYYMGFYIHSCPKMRYKGKLVPSYLLCPETYSWILLDEEIINKLDQSEYLRLNPDSNAKDENQVNTIEHLNNIVVLYNEECVSYRQYQQITRSQNQSEILEYGKLVGKVAASSMIILLD